MSRMRPSKASRGGREKHRAVADVPDSDEELDDEQFESAERELQAARKKKKNLAKRKHNASDDEDEILDSRGEDGFDIDPRELEIVKELQRQRAQAGMGELDADLDEEDENDEKEANGDSSAPTQTNKRPKGINNLVCSEMSVLFYFK